MCLCDFRGFQFVCARFFGLNFFPCFYLHSVCKALKSSLFACRLQAVLHAFSTDFLMVFLFEKLLAYWYMFVFYLLNSFWRFLIRDRIVYSISPFYFIKFAEAANVLFLYYKMVVWFSLLYFKNVILFFPMVFSALWFIFIVGGFLIVIFFLLDFLLWFSWGLKDMLSF